MYRDIMENYDKFGDNLKSYYPEIISVINQGMDTKDTKVSIIGLERYYQSRKQQAVKGKEKTTMTTTRKRQKIQ